MAGVEQAVAELLLGPAPTPERLAELCEAHGVGPDDAAALTASLERLGVYRELVRGNLRAAIRLSIPRSMARLGPLFDEYFDRFLQERAPRTHYLRDVTTELIHFCAPLWTNDSRVPRYLHELALHESLHIEVSALPSLPIGYVAQPLALEQGVRFGAALRCVQYQHAVHELPDDEDDRSVPAERAVSLLVYRSPDHEVRYLELTPLASAIIRRLLDGDRLGNAVTEAALGSGAPLTAAVIEGAAKLLADLAERGVIWGPSDGSRSNSASRPAP